MGKRVRFSDQTIIIMLLIIALFLFIEALLIYRFIREVSSVEFEVGFTGLTTELKILLGSEGYVLRPGENLILKVHRNEKLIVEQGSLGRYTIKSGEKIIDVSIPLVEASVR